MPNIKCDFDQSKRRTERMKHVQHSGAEKGNQGNHRQIPFRLQQWLSNQEHLKHFQRLVQSQI